MDESEKRIGVFICSCGGHIGRIIDCEEVSSHVKKLEGVVFSAVQEHLCREDEKIKREIRRNDVDRLVIAACPPDKYRLFFDNICYESGIDPYLMERTNIREQCAWVHPPRDATEKAKHLIEMSIAKVSSIEPPLSDVPNVNEDECIGCGSCGEVCPYKAITFKDEEKMLEEVLLKTRKSHINPVLCHSCGLCAVECPTGAIRHPSTVVI